MNKIKFLILSAFMALVTRSVQAQTINGALLISSNTLIGGATFYQNGMAVIPALTVGTTAWVMNSSGPIVPSGLIGNNISVVLHSSTTLHIPSNGFDLQKYVYRLIQDGAGSRSVLLDSAFHFGSNVSTWTYAVAASSTSYLGCIYDTSNASCDIVSGSIGGY